jgi:diguanylate cyclase (GGDEF)-like protein
LPLTLTTLTDIALVLLGAVVGALGFSFVVGRHRTRQIARLADRLARATSGTPPPDPGHFPDPVLDVALHRLTARIAEVESMAATDQLTRLLSRPACLQFLGAEIDRANRYERPLTVALIDIDHFKRTNDTYGHAVGDDVLRHVAALLRSTVRAVDSLGRYGGEEFLLVMPETDMDGGLASAENLRRVVGRTPLVFETAAGASEIRVTISIGVAGHPGQRSLDVDRLLREADGALYEAKERGRDQVQAHRPLDESSSLSRATIDARARKEATRIARAAFEASNNELLGALSDRASWAGGTSQLIADLSAELGRAIGLPDGDIERIRTASLLHDLGKLAIPDEILSKPGPLSPPEWRTIVEHPKIGQIVLEQAGAIRDAASIVLHHHEWFDGRGYPHGLAGAEIPIGSRIVAIADAYEALISDRPYSAAMSHIAAIDELQRQAGIQFDPDLVELFITLIGDGSRLPGPARLDLVAGSAGEQSAKRARGGSASRGPRGAGSSSQVALAPAMKPAATHNGTGNGTAKRAANAATNAPTASKVRRPRAATNSV